MESVKSGNMGQNGKWYKGSVFVFITVHITAQFGCVMLSYSMLLVLILPTADKIL